MKVMLKLEGRVSWEQHCTGQIPHSEQDSLLTVQTLFHHPVFLIVSQTHLFSIPLSPRDPSTWQICGKVSNFKQHNQTSFLNMSRSLREIRMYLMLRHTPLLLAILPACGRLKEGHGMMEKKCGSLIGYGLRDSGIWDTNILQTNERGGVDFLAVVVVVSEPGGGYLRS
jgi:hypothetical protein